MLSNLPNKKGRVQNPSELARLKTELEADANLAHRAKAPSTLRRLLANKPAVVCLGYLALLGLAALFAPVLASYDYKYQDLGHVREYPSTRHWLGTDSLGRDILSRLLYGARISLLVGFVVVAADLVLGMFVGLIAGYFGGWLDALLMRLVDLTYAFPGLLLAVFLVGVLGRDLIWLMVAFIVLGWPGTARLVRAQLLAVRKQDYILASRASGASDWRIIFRHALPNCASAVIVRSSMAVGGIMVAEAGLSFLGLGVQPPYPSWGNMINDLAQLIRPRPWLLGFPCLALSLTVLALNLLGDALRDALDPAL
jgi:ABC-type dipeptide/oligopeptide/nickel transport system permease subunit